MNQEWNEALSKAGFKRKKKKGFWSGITAGGKQKPVKQPGAATDEDLAEGTRRMANENTKQKTPRKFPAISPRFKKLR